MTRGLGGHSPANVSKYLKGIDFPATRRDLRLQAEDNGADPDVMDVILSLPDDVMAAYGEAARTARGGD